jgi:signal transduction histidine kinase/integral membrane sensor domain MASE1
MRGFVKRSGIVYLAQVLLVAVLYLVAARLGLTLAFYGRVVTLVWPPAGIALAAILLAGYRVVPGLVLGAFLANIAGHAPLGFAVGTAIGNPLAAVLAAYLLHRAGFRNSLERVRDILALILLGAMAGAFISATIGVTSLCLSGLASWSQFASVWLGWWLGDAMGVLVVAPFLLTWGTPPRPRWRLRRAIEAGALLIVLLGLGLAIYGGRSSPSRVYVLSYAIFPLLAWATLRFRQRGLTALTLVWAVLSVWGAVRDSGPFAQLGMQTALLYLSFINVVMLSALLLAAAISERMTAEQNLRGSEAWLSSIIRSIPVGMHMYRLEPDGRLVFTGANPAADAILGVDNRQFVGQTLEEAFPAIVSTEVPVQYRRVAATGEPWHSDQVNYEGGEIKGAFEVHAFQTIPGRMAAAFMDVTHHVQTEEALRRQNGYLAALHDTSLGLLGRLDPDDLLQALVSRAAQLLGAPFGFIYLAEPGADELVLRVVVGLARQTIDERLAIGEGVAGKVWATGEPLVINDYGSWPDHSPALPRDLIRAIVGVPLRLETYVAGVIGLAYDYTSRRTFSDQEVELLGRFAQLASIALDNARLFAEAKEARIQAEDANQAKSIFLAKVSHELRTPLTSIVGFTRIIQKRLDSRILPALSQPNTSVQKAVAEVDEDLDIMMLEGQRLAGLINDLLDLAKIEAGKVEWSMQPVSMQQVFYRAAGATASLFVAKKLKMSVEVEEGLPEVLGDYDRLVQVMVNLLSNAVKFTDTGAITCRVWRAGDEIWISVADMGIGIAQTDFPGVFEPFVQAGDGRYGGTGLGLPISKQIVEAHGGRIWFESVPGQGSTFTFALPIPEAALPSGPAGSPTITQEEGDGSL